MISIFDIRICKPLFPFLVTIFITVSSFGTERCLELFKGIYSPLQLGIDQVNELLNYPGNSSFYRAQSVGINDLNNLIEYLDIDAYPKSALSRQARLTHIEDVIRTQGLPGLAKLQLGQDTPERLTLSATEDLSQITHIESYGQNDIGAILSNRPTLRVLAQTNPDPAEFPVLFVSKYVVRSEIAEVGLIFRPMPKAVKWFLITGRRDSVRFYEIIELDEIKATLQLLSERMIRNKYPRELIRAEQMLSDQLESINGRIVRRDHVLESIAKLNYYSNVIDVGRRQEMNGNWVFSNSLSRVIEVLKPFVETIIHTTDIRARRALELTQARLRKRMSEQIGIEKSETSASVKTIQQWLRL